MSNQLSLSAHKHNHVAKRGVLPYKGGMRKVCCVRVSTPVSRVVGKSDCQGIVRYVINGKNYCARHEHMGKIEQLRAELTKAREAIEPALRYIQHVGANAVMRGQPHPQQWIVDALESVMKSKP